MKSKHLDTTTFIKDFCQTLVQDKNNQFHLKIPIKNYEDLSLFRSAIVNAIAYTAALHEIEGQKNLPLTIHYLTHILHNIDLFNECSGLTVLLDRD